MTYTILERHEIINQVEAQISETETVTVEQKTVFTTVEYDFGGTIIVVEVPHFMPPDEDYIILGIENRAITEQRKLGLLP